MRQPIVRRWTEFEREVLRQMAEAGKSKIVIAARLKRPVPSIAKEAKSMGVELRDRKSAFSAEDLDEQRRTSSLDSAGLRLPRSGQDD